jgi:hypothetical protein
MSEVSPARAGLLEWSRTPPASDLKGVGVRERAEASQIVRALLVVLVLAVVVGVIVAVVSVTLLKSSGILPQTNPSNEHPAVIPPSSSPTTGTSTEPPTTQPAQTPSGLTTTTTPHSHRTIQLTANPPAAGTYERINLVGSYHGTGSPTLQVQRFEGGQWVDFPTTASVSGGQFSTYIETGHTGVNRLRLVDPSTGESSNVVEVNIS